MRRSLTLLAAVVYAAASAGLAAGLAVTSAAPASAAQATLTKVSPADGWETAPYLDNGGDKSAIGERFSSAAVGDLDGNGVPDLVAGFPDGTIVAWRTDTGARWFSQYTGPGAVQASPALVDYDHDGKLDIVYANTHGDIGVVSWDHRQLFYAKIGGTDNWSGAFATPAVADLDGNGTLDITVSGFDQYLHAWSGSGGPEMRGFPIHLEDTSWSSPAVGDIDGDGLPEIVVGWDCDGAPGQRYCAGSYGGVISAFNGDGTTAPGVWPRFMAGQTIWSSPAIADLDGNGTLDIVVGTGNMTNTMYAGLPMRGTKVFGLQGNGYDLPGWPVTVGRNVTSSPAVGDINGDGKPDVVFVAEDGMAYAYSGDGTRLWSRCAGNDPSLPPNDGSVTYGTECPILHASAAIADVLGDSTQEVIIGGEQNPHVFDGKTGASVGIALSSNGTYPITAAPTVANIGGKATIYAVTGNATNGRVFGWQTGSALGAADWPTFKGSSARSGALVRPIVLNAGPIKTKYDTKAALLGAPTSNEYAVPGGRAQNFSGGQILWSAATGAHEVHGLILDRYQRMGGASGPLGLPLTDEQPLTGGASSLFQGGGIYWSPPTGAWSVQGLIWAHYAALNGPAGTLGYPTSDEYGVPGGRASNFVNGVLFWSPATGAWSVQGAILEHYRVLGGTAGPLGFPTSDEHAVAGGRVSDFFTGSTYWSANTGAWAVYGAINARYLALGGASGPLNFPVTDEHDVPGGGRASNFLGGIVFWSPATGAHAVQGAILDRYNVMGMTGGSLGYPLSDETGEVGGRSSTFQGGRLYWSAGTGVHEVLGSILVTYLAMGGAGTLGIPTTEEYAVPGGRAQDYGHGRLRWDATSGAVTRI